MAHQLREQGQEVSFLVMFDVLPSVFPQIVPVTTLQRYEAYASRYRIKRYLTQLKDKNTITERIQYLITGFYRVVRYRIQFTIWIMAQTLFNKKFDNSLSKIFHNVEVANAMATRSYKPRIYPGDIALFQSKEGTEIYSHDHVKDWTGLGIGKIEVHLVSDSGIPNIGRMFKEPYVQDLSQQITAYLN